MFFQPDIRINIQKFSLHQYNKFHSGTVYKKESIQRNMDTKMLLLNGIKNKINKINNC